MSEVVFFMFYIGVALAVELGTYSSTCKVFSHARYIRNKFFLRCLIASTPYGQYFSISSFFCFTYLPAMVLMFCELQICCVYFLMMLGKFRSASCRIFQA